MKHTNYYIIFSTNCKCCLEKQMLKQYFQADADKYQSAEDFDFVFEKMSEFFADANTKIWEHKGYQAYDYHRSNNGAGDKWKRNANRQGIDTGRNGQDQQNKDIRRVKIFLDRFNLERLINHFSADRT